MAQKQRRRSVSRARSRRAREELSFHVLSVNLTSSTYAYFRKLIAAAVEGPRGKLGINPHLDPLIEAIHHALAGGEVSVTINKPGLPTKVREFGGLQETAIKQTNALLTEIGEEEKSLATAV